MPSSRFWRPIVTICYILSGAFVVGLISLVIKSAFFPNKSRNAPGENSNSSPTPASRSVTSARPPQSFAARLLKQSSGRRSLILISATLLTGAIAATFLFSMHFFSTSLGQTGNARANSPQLVRPAFERGIIWHSSRLPSNRR
jgi:flagellar basal body-associated protein FliL